jgi:GTP-binding protein
MFVDEITIRAAAGDGGNGVVRWRQEKFRPMAGPAGGNGGRGGDVYVRAVPDLNQLAKYTGAKVFTAGRGADGAGESCHGKHADDLIIDVPVGSMITDLARERRFEVLTVGEQVRILKGGVGGLGNEHFKSSTNRSPEESTRGRSGERGEFLIEVSLVVDVGLVGLPNAGKSTLLNLLTNAHSRVGAYPFTTIEPHLGALYELTVADIPGLIAGAATGKGLGHRFLRHISRTKMLVQLVSLEGDNPLVEYYTILDELKQYSSELLQKDRWVVLTKKDLVDKDKIDSVREALEKIENRVFVLSQDDADSVKKFRDALVAHVRSTYNTTNVRHSVAGK